jgi:vancomycin resistance protein VanW
VPYRLSVKLTDTHLVGSWSASRPQLQEYRIEERAHRITHEGPGVYVRHNELWRVQYDTAALATDEELVAENRALMMYQPLLPPISEVDVGS